MNQIVKFYLSALFGLMFISLKVTAYSPVLKSETDRAVDSFRLADEVHPIQAVDWRFSGRINFDGAYFFDRSTYNPIGNGVTIRRARFDTDARIDKNWSARLSLDFAGSAGSLRDAFVQYNFDGTNAFTKNLKLRAGNFKEAFSFEFATGGHNMSFAERSLVHNTLVPLRTLGLQAEKNSTHYYSALGIHFNGIGNTSLLDVSRNNNRENGIDEGISVTAKMVWLPLISPDNILHLGVAGSYSTPKTTNEVANSVAYSGRSSSFINKKKYLDTGVITNTKNTKLLNFELVYVRHNFMIQSQFIDNLIYGGQLNNVTGVNKAKLDGAFFQTGILLFGGSYKYDAQSASLSTLQPGRAWGDLELAFRIDYVNLNDRKAEIYGGSANACNIELNHYFNSRVRFMINYSYIIHDKYANGNNTLYVGYDENQMPTSNAFVVDTAKGKAGEQFGMLQTRLEIRF